MTIRLRFLGAAGNVTGSCYLLEGNGSRLLVDYGLYQEWSLKKRNWDTLPFPPDSVDAVLLTHAHLDHCGRLPKLVCDGFRGKIYCTEATADIARIILLDAARLQEEDADFKRKRHEREQRKGPFPEIPLYTVADAQDTFPLFSPVKYGQPVAVGQGIEASFHDAGHVLGSSMVRLRIDQASGPRTIIFSGDVGRWDRPILHDPKVFSQTDYVIVESTYGDRVHDPGDISDRLAEVVNAAYRAGGNIIVPSFALERTQEVLYYMNDLLMDNRIPHLLVFLDSPMAISITEVFKRHSELFDQDMTRLLKHHHSPFEFHGLKMVETVDESKSLNHITGTIMIIAGSGMCTGGRVKHHLVNNISRPESTILFVGYQASGTPGKQIVDGAEQVRLLGQSYPVRASIAQLNGFSSHADKNELLRWLSGLTAAPKHVFVTHGEAGSAEQFRQFLSAQTGWAVSVPEYGSAVSLE